MIDPLEIHKLTATLTARGIPDKMRDDERRAGFAVIRPGEASWLPLSAWHPDCVVSTDGERVRLVLLHALRPGHGAFLKMLIELNLAKLSPVVVEPTERLAERLTTWGWKSRRIGKGFHAQRIWYPRRLGHIHDK